METLSTSIYDVETDTFFVRELNEEELAQYSERKRKAEELNIAREKQIKAKVEVAGKLAALGLDADDLKALGL
jgi:hypothetical protein